MAIPTPVRPSDVDRFVSHVGERTTTLSPADVPYEQIPSYLQAEDTSSLTIRRGPFQVSMPIAPTFSLSDYTMLPSGASYVFELHATPTTNVLYTVPLPTAKCWTGQDITNDVKSGERASFILKADYGGQTWYCGVTHDMTYTDARSKTATTIGAKTAFVGNMQYAGNLGGGVHPHPIRERVIVTISTDRSKVVAYSSRVHPPEMLIEYTPFTMVANGTNIRTAMATYMAELVGYGVDPDKCLVLEHNTPGGAWTLPWNDSAPLQAALTAVTDDVPYGLYMIRGITTNSAEAGVAKTFTNQPVSTVAAFGAKFLHNARKSAEDAYSWAQQLKTNFGCRMIFTDVDFSMDPQGGSGNRCDFTAGATDTCSIGDLIAWNYGYLRSLSELGMWSLHEGARLNFDNWIWYGQGSIGMTWGTTGLVSSDFTGAAEGGATGGLEVSAIRDYDWHWQHRPASTVALFTRFFAAADLPLFPEGQATPQPLSMDGTRCQWAHNIAGLTGAGAWIADSVEGYMPKRNVLVSYFMVSDGVNQLRAQARLYSQDLSKPALAWKKLDGELHLMEMGKTKVYVNFGAEKSLVLPEVDQVTWWLPKYGFLAINSATGAFALSARLKQGGNTFEAWKLPGISSGFHGNNVEVIHPVLANLLQAPPTTKGLFVRTPKFVLKETTPGTWVKTTTVN